MKVTHLKKLLQKVVTYEEWLTMHILTWYQIVCKRGRIIYYPHSYYLLLRRGDALLFLFINLSFIFVALSCKSRQWVIGIIQNLKIDVLCSTSIKIAQYYFIFILKVKKFRMTLIIDLLSRDCYIYDKPSSKRIQSVVL